MFIFTLLCGALKGFMRRENKNKKCENKNLSYFFLFVRDWDVKG